MVAYAPTLTPTAAQLDAVLGVIIKSESDTRGGGAGYQPFGILISHTPGGKVEGGLTGYALFDWLFVQYLGVPDHLRGQGIGTELMHRAEAWARQQGLIGIWLDTFEFQARPFYEKLGFIVFGTIEDHPLGSRRYFMSKRFEAPSA